MRRDENFGEMLERGTKYKVVSLEELAEIIWPITVPLGVVQKWGDDILNNETTISIYLIMSNRLPDGESLNQFPSLWLWIRLGQQ